MKIKKLELLGFKSFKDRTVIHFDKGITGIVGPNGCGKSNIVDALIWVMGEMSVKHLRGSTMTDVIFAGAQGYSPMGFAEVSLTLENDGGVFPPQYMKRSEITLTRKLHSSGKSEYLINREPARLRDIQEVFMDTGVGAKGFSIIEQGAIEKLITAKPEERKVIIEEAAGITKFKVRKRESERKLEQTEHNLVRLSDILKEQERQIESLKRQAEKAESYKLVRDELEEKELWVLVQTYLKFKNEYDGLKEESGGKKEEKDVVEAQISKKRNLVEVLRNEVSALQTQINDKQVGLQKLKENVIRQEGKISEYELRFEQAQKSQELSESVFGKYEKQREKLLDEKKEALKKIDSIKPFLDKSKQELSELQEKFKDVEEKKNQAEKDLKEKEAKVLSLTQTHSIQMGDLKNVDYQEDHIKETLEKLETELKTAEANIKSSDKKYQDLNKKVSQEKQLKLDIVKNMKDFESSLQKLKEKLEKGEKGLENLTGEKQKKEGLLVGLENVLNQREDFNEGVKNVISWNKKFKVLSDFLDVPPKYEKAVYGALGSYFQVILSPSKKDALEAIKYLKQKGGESYFIFDEALKEGPSKKSDILKEKGVSGCLVDFVKAGSLNSSCEHLLESCFLVDDLDVALSLYKKHPTYRFVTLEGDLVFDRLMKGGKPSSSEYSFLSRKRKIKELLSEKEKLESEENILKKEIQQMHLQMKKLKQERHESQKTNEERGLALAQIEKDLESVSSEKKQFTELYQSKEKEMDSLRSQKESLEEKKKTFVKTMSQLEASKNENQDEMNDLVGKIEDFGKDFENFRKQMNHKELETEKEKQKLESFEKDLDKVQKELRETEDELTRLANMKKSDEEILEKGDEGADSLKEELNQLIQSVQEAEKDLSQDQNKYQEKFRQANELSTEVSSVSQNLSSLASQIQEKEMKKEQLELKMSHVDEQTVEKYRKSVEEFVSTYQDVERNFDETKKRVEQLKTKINSMGAVNLVALEEFEECKQKFSFLSQQHEDLVSSKKQLEKMIRRIDTVCSTRFNDMFENVNTRFEKVFPVMFGGGEAHLIMVKNEESGEVGIDVMARPPGKKMVTLSLLSGGEKALTSVALIFSISLIKPSPFCLLDEVDAPLDDANVIKFNELIKEMAKRSQVVLVTHNKHTMRVNKKLFGVTQEEKGVSKMISVSFEEAEKVLEQT